MTRALVITLVLFWCAPVRAQDGASALGAPERPAAAHAPPPGHPPEFSLDLDAMTVLPLIVGAMASFEVPGHIVIRAGGGAVPSAYVDAVNSVGTGWGLYGQDAATMASLVLNGATFLEFGLAIRPAGTPGIELAVSYALLWAHRTFDMTQLGAAEQIAGLDVTVDAIHGEVAWSSEPIDHVYFRIALGWAHGFDHHVSIASSGDAATQRVMHDAADALAIAVGRYAFGPTLAAALGVRF